MAIINKDRYNALRTVLNEIKHDNFNRLVSIEDKNHDIFSKDLEWGVNWSCCGTQDVKTAYEMVNFMEAATDIASCLNEMGLQLSWEDDKELGEWFKISPESARFEYGVLKNSIKSAIEEQSWDDLQSILTAGN